MIRGIFDDLLISITYFSSIFFEELSVYKIKKIKGGQSRKAPKGRSESPWSLHTRSFWKIHFINPPEA
jgi:hypothetical protein